MPSIFSRSHSTPKKDKASTFTTPRRGNLLSPPSSSKGGRRDRNSPSASEFGAFPGPSRTLPNRPTHPLTPPLAPDRDSVPPLLPPKYTFLPTRIPPYTPSDNSVDSFSYSTDEVTGLKHYGFLGGIGSRVTLGLEDAGKLVREVSHELLRRGLATPMLFSNQALELNQIRVKMLITAYLDLISGHSLRPYPDAAFKQDLQFAKEHELAWLLRWALSRVTRMRDGIRVICHGLIEWEVYEEWRGRERGEPGSFLLLLSAHTAVLSVAAYPTTAFPFLASISPAEVHNQLVAPLFHLLSRFAAHSHLSGLTPHALSSLFAPLLFDIPTGVSAILAHSAFVRAASATEHLLLAYIRSTSTVGDLGLSDLPSRLKGWVTGYPAMLASDADLARGAPRRGARVVRCECTTRTVRAYTKDLVVQAELWADESVGAWEAWNRVTWKARRGETSRPKFSAAWRRRMLVKETLPLPSSVTTSSDLNRQMSYGLTSKPGHRSVNRQQRIEEDPDEAKWGTLAGKEWSMFEEGGFDAPTLVSVQHGEGDMSSRLQFDLNEGAKLGISERRRTMDWSEFASPSGGFNRTDSLLDVSLNFSAPIETSITDWPKERDELRKRLHKSQKEATPFDYDTTPRFGANADIPSSPGLRPDGQGRVYLEEAFVDCWADLMMGCAWMDLGDLTFREANWALIEHKAKPPRVDNPDADPLMDPRTTELYFLFEERVPPEYQMALMDPKHQKKSGFGLFSPKAKKRTTATTRPDDTRSGQVLERGHNEFDRMLLNRQQAKKLTLTKSASDQPNSSVWHKSRDSDDTLPVSPVKAVKSREWKRSGEAVYGSTDQRRTSSGTTEDSRSSDMKNSFFSKAARSGSKVLQRVKTNESAKDQVKATQTEQEMDFELQSASDLSSADTSPRDQQRKMRRDDQWMDVLIANGARPMERQDTGPAVPESATKPNGFDLPQSSNVPSGMRLLDAAKPIVKPRLSPPELPGVPDDERHLDTITNEARHPIRRTVASSDDELGSDFEPVSPIPEGEQIRFSPTTPRPKYSYAEENDLVAPRPCREQDTRDTIHNIVEQYDRDHTPDPEHDQLSDDGESYKISDVHQEDVHPEASSHGMEGGEQSQFSPRCPSEYEDESPDHTTNGAPALGDPIMLQSDSLNAEILKAPEPIFDLTPGREPSPARYKHGEPLHFVDEEAEEDEY